MVVFVEKTEKDEEEERTNSTKRTDQHRQVLSSEMRMRDKGNAVLMKNKARNEMIGQLAFKLITL
jgi:hypothetical protein